jgi:regulator of protease activity HflC (stomatin/prohibitin superfamily)
MRDGIRQGLNCFWDRYSIVVYVTGLIGLFFIVYFASHMLRVVEAGHGGIMWRRFDGGVETGRVYMEGLQVVPPWDVFTIYDLRVQEEEAEFEVITRGGLALKVIVSIRYHPRVEFLGQLHQQIGPDYLNKVVKPEIQSMIRAVFGNYSPEEIYSTKRGIIETTFHNAQGAIVDRFVVVDDLLIKSIILPEPIRRAIESKLTEEQRWLEMTFRIRREELEAERKIIEARGINTAHQIIGETLSPEVLTFKGIEASLELAKSPNAKVLLFGGRDGLPVILDATDRGAPVPAISGDKVAEVRGQANPRTSVSSSTTNGMETVK